MTYLQLALIHCRPVSAQHQYRRGNRFAEMGKQVRAIPPEGFRQATHIIGAVKRFAEFCQENVPETVVTDRCAMRRLRPSASAIGSPNSLMERSAISSPRAPRTRGGWAGKGYVVRCTSMASQALSASANVLKGDPPTLTAVRLRLRTTATLVADYKREAALARAPYL